MCAFFEQLDRCSDLALGIVTSHERPKNYSAVRPTMERRVVLSAVFHLSCVILCLYLLPLLVLCAVCVIIKTFNMTVSLLLLSP